MVNNSNQFKLLFYGLEPDLSAIIEKYFQTTLHSLETSSQRLQSLNEFDIEISSMLFLDVSSELSFTEEEFAILDMLKNFGPSNSLPIILIVKGKEQLLRYEPLFALGINYMFVLGNDVNQFLSNLHYIATESEKYRRKYARAKVNNLAYRLQSLSFVSSLDEGTISIDSDINVSEDVLNAEINLFEEFKCSEFEIIEKLTGAESAQAFYHYQLKIPFLSSWNLGDEDGLAEDSYLSWLEFNNDSFKQQQPRALLLTESTKLINEISQRGSMLAGLDLSIVSHLSDDLRGNFLEQFNLILIDISNKDTYSQIDELMHYLKYEKLSPIVILSNHRSTTESIRKVYSYEKVICTSYQLTINELMSMIGDIKKSNTLVKSHQFDLLDRRKVVAINFDVTITSISENGMSFSSEYELPLYSHLKVDKPLEIHMLVVPLYDNSLKGEGSYHYQTIFMGLTEEESSYLRMFTNDCIKKPLLEWKHLALNELFTDFEKTRTDKKEKAPEIVEKISPNHQADVTDLRIKSKDMKSKL